MVVDRRGDESARPVPLHTGRQAGDNKTWLRPHHQYCEWRSHRASGVLIGVRGREDCRATLFKSTAPLFLAHGVHVFSLNPGAVRTTLTHKGCNSEAGRRFAAATPVNQYLPAERAAGHAVFLASGEGDLLVGLHLSVFDELDEAIADERLSDSTFLTLRVQGLK